MNPRIGVIAASVLITAASGASAQGLITGLAAGATYSDLVNPDSKSRWGFSGGLFVGVAGSHSFTTLEASYTQKGGEGAHIDYIETGITAGAVSGGGSTGSRGRLYGGITVAFPISCDAPSAPLNAFCDNTETEWGSPFGLMVGKWSGNGSFVGLDVRYTFPWTDASLGVSNQTWRFAFILGRAKGGAR